MKIYDAVRLILTTHLSDRSIAAASGASATTVRKYRRTARAKKLVWSNLVTLPPAAFNALFNQPKTGRPRRIVPDWAAVHADMQRKGMTLQLCWEEYRQVTPVNALCYSQFAALYRAYLDTLPTVMRQHHVHGERAFVDFSGVRPSYTDRTAGKTVNVELFVGVLPASGYFFATCVASQKVPDWIGAHVAMLEFFGGSPQVIVPDNLRSAVVTAGRNPTIQRSYADFARYYDLTILPARPYKPRDKGAVEQAVRFAQQRILARLRSSTFHSLDDINAAIAPLLNEANDRVMTEYGQSRRERFEKERPTLRALPSEPYVYGEWVRIERTSQDYHVPIFGHFYSVPHRFVGERIDARVTDTHVELFHQRQCVGRHARSTEKGGHTTLASHQTPEHRAQAQRTPEDTKAWANGVGPNVIRFVRKALAVPRPFEGLKVCDRLRGLAHKHGTEAVEAAMGEAFALGSPRISTVQRVLASRKKAEASAPKPHANVQGAQRYLRGPHHVE